MLPYQVSHLGLKNPIRIRLNRDLICRFAFFKTLAKEQIRFALVADDVDDVKRRFPANIILVDKSDIDRCLDLVSVSDAYWRNRWFEILPVTNTMDKLEEPQYLCTIRTWIEYGFGCIELADRLDRHHIKFHFGVTRFYVSSCDYASAMKVMKDLEDEYAYEFQQVYSPQMAYKEPNLIRIWGFQETGRDTVEEMGIVEINSCFRQLFSEDPSSVPRYFLEDIYVSRVPRYFFDGKDIYVSRDDHRYLELHSPGICWHREYL